MIFSIIALLWHTLDCLDEKNEVVVRFCCYQYLHGLEFRLDTLGVFSVDDDERALHIQLKGVNALVVTCNPLLLNGICQAHGVLIIIRHGDDKLLFIFDSALCVLTHIVPNILCYLLHVSEVITSPVAAGFKNDTLQAITPANEFCWLMQWLMKGSIPSALASRRS